jgi:hypothetical protein
MEMATLEDEEAWDEDTGARLTSREKRRRLQPPSGSEDRRFGTWDGSRALCLLLLLMGAINTGRAFVAVLRAGWADMSMIC